MIVRSRLAVSLRVAATCVVVGPPVGGLVAGFAPVVVRPAGRSSQGEAIPTATSAGRTLVQLGDLLGFVPWASYEKGLPAALLAGLGLGLLVANGRRLSGPLAIAVGIAAVPVVALPRTLPGLFADGSLDAVAADVLLTSIAKCPVAAVAAAQCWRLFPAETRPGGGPSEGRAG